jgi:hypothetical protein
MKYFKVHKSKTTKEVVWYIYKEKTWKF